MAIYRRLILLKYLVPIVLIYFVWMDVRMYFYLQRLPINYQDSNGTRLIDNDWLKFLNVFSIKLIMMDEANLFIFIPLAELFNEKTNFIHTFPFISPNLISLSGILVSLLAMKYLQKNNYRHHLLAILLFELRTFVDALDGAVARDYLGIKKHKSILNSFGHYIDGISDALGFLFFVIGCETLLRNRQLNKQNYSKSPNDDTILPLISTEFDRVKDGDKHEQCSNSQYNCSSRLKLKLNVCFSFLVQLAISSFFWNRYTQVYGRLFEDNRLDEDAKLRQSELLKSVSSSLVFLVWRLFNSQSLMQFLVLAILSQRIQKFFQLVQFNYFILLFAVLCTEMHIQYSLAYIH